MAAFAVAEIFEVTDPEAMAAYGKATGETLATHGGRIVAAQPGRAVEGDWAPNRLVIVQFDTMEALETWYNSPEYQELIKQRQAASRAHMTFVDGV
jgi:uncharacterized protein (DUF1330 family)